MGLNDVFFLKLVHDQRIQQSMGLQTQVEVAFNEAGVLCLNTGLTSKSLSALWEIGSMSDKKPEKSKNVFELEEIISFWNRR